MKKQILLAYDDPHVCGMLQRVLGAQHYEVVVAGTGDEFTAKSLEELPDLFLLDLDMPDRERWNAFDLLSLTPPFVPVIAITARPQQYEHAAEMGIDVLMEKPLSLASLLAAVDDLLVESGSERAPRRADPGDRSAQAGQRAQRSPKGARQ